MVVPAAIPTGSPSLPNTIGLGIINSWNSPVVASIERKGISFTTAKVPSAL